MYFACLTAAQSDCPVYLRVLNSVSPATKADPSVPPANATLIVNGRTLISNVQFRQFSNYVAINNFDSITFVLKDGAGNDLYPARTFRAASGEAFTIVVSGGSTNVSGAFSGPKVIYDTPPYVILEDIRPPNSGRFRGNWYRMSETSAFVDFRIVPSELGIESTDSDVVRLLADNPKTVLDFPDLVPGTYSFLPAVSPLQQPSSPAESQQTWSYARVLNSALGEYVMVSNVTLAAGDIISVAATGVALGTPSPYSLQLTSTIIQSTYDASTGCISITGVGSPVSFSSTAAEMPNFIRTFSSFLYNQ